MDGKDNRNKLAKKFIWHHFRKNQDSNDATCNYCQTKFKTTYGNTSILMYHLLRYHRKTIKNIKPGKIVIKPSIKFSPKKSNATSWLLQRDHLVPKQEVCPKGKLRSSIWKHYIRNDAQQSVVCVNCNREFKMLGNTSNLRRHLLSCHNTFTVEPQSGGRSFVWNHFIKCKESDYVMCKHCNRKYKACGNTSNFRSHLLRFHRDLLIQNRELKEDVNTDPLKLDSSFFHNVKVEPMTDEGSVDVDSTYEHLPRKNCSFVWLHFQKTELRRIVVCNYCSKVINTCGSTSSLRYHLMKHHKDKINNDEDSAPLDSDNISNVDNFALDESTSAVQNILLGSKDNYEFGEDTVSQKMNLRKSTSFVWEHFEKSADKKSAVCNHCQEECRTSGNTTNLRQHLERRHSNLMALDEDISEYEEKSEQIIQCDEFAVSEGIAFPKNPNRKRRSFVWRHFQKTNVRHTAVCYHCLREIKTSGGTSGLRYHVMKYHKEKINSGDLDSNVEVDNSALLEGITYDGNSIEVNSNYDEGNDVPSTAESANADKPNGRHKSFVWKHFKKSSAPDKAICNYCFKICNTTSGNTTSLKAHLIKFHPEEIVDDEAEAGLITTNILTGKRSRSHVWHHFEKTEHPNKVKCFHCCNIFNSSGNTSNLRDHLVRKHKEEYKVMVNKENGQLAAYITHEEIRQSEVSENVVSKRLSKSFVWDHFEKTDIPQIAVCHHCNKQCRTYGNTTNLAQHLTRHHKDKLEGYNDDNSLQEMYSEYLLEEENMPNIELLHEKQEILEPEEENQDYTEEWVPPDDNASDGSRQEENASEEKNEQEQASLESGEQLPKQPRLHASIWDHFVKDEDGFMAVCRYCILRFRASGTTSNLWRHLRRHHKDEVREVLKRKVAKTRNKSQVWNHFKKTKNRKRAFCIHCRKLYTYAGNTTNLWRHLSKQHSITYGSSAEENPNELNIDSVLIVEDNLDAETTPKKRCRSIVWKHFDKGDEPQTAICCYCKKEYNTCGNTSNLWSHLVSQHPEQIESVKNEDTATRSDIIISVQEEFETIPEKEKDTPTNRKRSKVWNHFNKTERSDVVVCIHCNEYYKRFGSTTNLWKHLLSQHPDNIGMSEEEEPIEQAEISEVALNADKSAPKHRRSSVWNYFEKNDELKKAVCIYCGGTYTACGPTSNLWKHVIRHHGENIPKEVDAELLDEELLNEEVSAEEIHIYCEKESKNFERADLKAHLMEYHRVPVDSEGVSNVADGGDEGAEIFELYDPDEGITGEPHRGSVWRYFEKIVTPQFAICSYCHLWCELGENLSNLKDHLMTHHGEDITGKSIAGRSVVGEDNASRDVEQSDNNKTNPNTDPPWRNFRKSIIPDFVACNQCGKLCKENKSLTDHLQTCRGDIEEANVFQTVETNENQTGDYSVSKGTASPKSTKTKSFVWKHFHRIKDQRIAICNYCNKALNTHGNTTNLRNHLATHHRDVIDDKDFKDFIQLRSSRCVRKSRKTDPGIYLHDFSAVEDILAPAPTYKNSSASFVWNHFEKTKIKQFAICNHCHRLCKTCGNTSNLKNHLMRHHRDVITMSGEVDEYVLGQESAEEEATDMETKYIIKSDQIEVVDEHVPMELEPAEQDYISNEDIAKVKDSADVHGLDEYLILVVR